MKKIFNKSLFKILFVLGIVFISANICSAAISVVVSADPTIVSYGGGTSISWRATGGATSCSESGGRGGSGTTGSFYVDHLYATTTFTVTCAGAAVGGVCTTDYATCFIANTKVTLVNGVKKNIQDIKIGDVLKGAMPVPVAIQ